MVFFFVRLLLLQHTHTHTHTQREKFITNCELLIHLYHFLHPEKNKQIIFESNWIDLLWIEIGVISLDATVRIGYLMRHVIPSKDK
jgi:hypothetical protein